MSCPCPVPGCDRYASEWLVCRSCAARLGRDLSAIPALVDQVSLTLARQSGSAPRSGARSTEEPLVYNLAASEALGSLKAVLVGWVRDLVEHGAHPWPADSEAACARWLLLRVAVLRMHPAAGEIVAEVGETTSRCWRVIDRPPNLWFAGPCEGCGRDLYAEAGAITATCSACGGRHEVLARRAYLLDAARECELTMADLLRVLPQWLGAPLNDSTLRSWRRRGRVLPRGLTLAGRETFRVGDVLDLIEGSPRSGAA